MRRMPLYTRTALAVLGLTLLAASLGRTERKKAFVDPLLGRIMRASEKAARDTGRPEAIPKDELKFFGRQAVVDEEAAVPAVRVRLQLDAATRHSIETMGIRTYGRMDGFASALIPVTRLRDVAALPGVERMQAMRIPRMELNVSKGEVLSTQVESVYGSRGQGVIYGSIDSGVDWRHDDFRKPDGTTRIKYIWSQDDACVGTPPAPPFDFGCLYTEADVNAALTGGPPITAPDGEGHGTLTTGIGAGNGRATGNGYPSQRYVGMAPEADIIMVKVFNEPTDTSGCPTCGDLSAAMDFIDTMAGNLGKPYVINVSLGSQFGGHDGSDLDEMTIDSLIGSGIPGKAIVKSAGNERGHSVHIGGTAVANVTNTHQFTIPTYTSLPGIFNDTVAWSVWYQNGDNLTVTIADPPTSPCGASVLTQSATTGGGLVFNASTSGTMLIDDSASPAPNGMRFFDMEVDDQNTSVPCRGVWELRVRGNTITAGGRYDAWIWYSTFGAAQAEALWNALDNTRTISVPGTAFDVTTVGSYMTKHSWLSTDGFTYHVDGTFPSDVGKISYFSSPGPTRDGRLKPEISAGGQMIVSTLSQDVVITAGNEPLVVEDDQHFAQQGTSFSSPTVAGIYAQILALNPNLDAIDLRTLATATARVDANVLLQGPVPNNDWGYGKVSAKAMADRAVQNIPDVNATGPGSFGWTALPTATTYNVYRGDLLLSAPGYYGSCLESARPSPSFSDATIPTEGGGFFYLVTGVWNGIEGSLGFTSDGTPRINSSPCP